MGCLVNGICFLASLLIGIGLAMLHPALGVIYAGIWLCGTAATLTMKQEAK